MVSGGVAADAFVVLFTFDKLFAVAVFALSTTAAEM